MVILSFYTGSATQRQLQRQKKTHPSIPKCPLFLILFIALCPLHFFLKEQEKKWKINYSTITVRLQPMKIVLIYGAFFSILCDGPSSKGRTGYHNYFVRYAKKNNAGMM
jgi:hypothetical protein